MTDSGSFDPGDLIYGADWNNLSNLINAKCAEAGISPLTWGVSAGATISASTTNTLVAKYQALWDASSNKPGTRQSTVASGGLIYGSLFQNMWTQLNQMTFAFNLASWNEASENGDANTFVCLMENPTANGNETGVGGGLSGSDLVLTPQAAVAGASGGWRGFNTSPAGMLSTAAFANAFLQGRSTFTWMAKFRNFTHPSSNGEYCEFYNGSQWFNVQRNSGPSAGVRLCGFGIDDVKWFPTIIPTTGTVYVAAWRNGATFRAGWKDAKFSTWAELPSGQRLEWTTLNANTFTAFSREGDILGYRSNSNTFDAAWVLMSKSCLIN